MPTLDSSVVSRRAFIGAGLAAVAVGALAACAPGAKPAPTGGALAGTLRASWFGGDSRHVATQNAFKIIEDLLPEVSIETEFGGFDGYFDKLTTQISARSAPALVQMNFDPQLPDFGKRGALTDLSAYVGNGLDLSAIPEPGVEGGTIDGKVFGVSLGTVVAAVMVDSTALEPLGLTPPAEWTWEGYADFANEIYDASNGTLAGTEDASSYDNDLAIWLLERGRGGIFNAQGELAATKDDMVEWFTYWEDLRKSGGAVSIDIQAAHNNGNHPTNPVVLGKAALGLQFSTTRAVWAGLTPNALQFHAIPSGGSGSEPGNFGRPAALWSVPTGTQDVDLAVAVIDLFINNPEVARALRFERAVPNQVGLDAMSNSLTPDEQALVDYTASVLEGPLSPAYQTPSGASQIATVLKTKAEEVAFGRSSISEAAQGFIDEAEAMVS